MLSSLLSSLKKNRYRVLLNGENFRIKFVDGVETLGFMTTRYVDAENPEQAAEMAKDSVWNELSDRMVAADNPPLLTVEEMYLVKWTARRFRSGRGFTFYDMEDGDEDSQAEPKVIFVLERNGDLSAYSSVTEAEQAMESPDIESGEYVRAFDENGNVFSIGTVGTVRLDVGIIPKPGILTPTNENAAAELYDLLWIRLQEKSPKGETPLKKLSMLALELSKRNRSGYLPTLR